MRRRSASRILLLLVGLSASIVFTYLAVRDVDLGLFWEGLTESEYLWLGPAFVALAAAAVVRAVRWQLCFPHDSRPPFGPALRALLVGQLFNNILPARAGEAARIVLLHREAGTSRAAALGTAVVERLYDLVALLLLLFLATPFLPDVDWLQRAGAVALFLLLVVLVLVVVLQVFGDRPLRFLLRPFGRLPGMGAERIDRAAISLTYGFRALHRARLALPVFAVTLLSWLLIALAFWLTLLGFESKLGFEAGLLVAVTTTIAAVIPSLPAAVGVFEAAALVALRPYGVPDSRALSYAVVLHALNFFPYVVAGYVALHWHTRAGRRTALSERP